MARAMALQAIGLGFESPYLQRREPVERWLAGATRRAFRTQRAPDRR